MRSKIWSSWDSDAFLAQLADPLSVSIAKGYQALAKERSYTDHGLDLNFVSLVLNRNVIPFKFADFTPVTHFECDENGKYVTFSVEQGNSIDRLVKWGEIPNADYGNKYLDFRIRLRLDFRIAKDGVKTDLGLIVRAPSGRENKQAWKFFNEKIFLNEKALNAFVAFLDEKMSGALTKYVNGDEIKTEPEQEQNENAA